MGLTEEAAKENGVDYRMGKFSFTASGKAVTIDYSEGFAELIVEEKYGEIPGAHAVQDKISPAQRVAAARAPRSFTHVVKARQGSSDMSAFG